MAHHKLSSQLKEIQNQNSQNSITIESFIQSLGEKGHWMVVFFFSIPFVQPVPMMGLSTIFGAVIAGVGFSLMFHRDPFIPKKFKTRLISNEVIQRICYYGIKVFTFCEKWVKPRGSLLANNPSISRFSGFMVVICSVLLALPLPIPASNMVPALPMVLLAIGHLEEDSYAIGLAYFLCVGAVLAFIALFVMPYLFYQKMATY